MLQVGGGQTDSFGTDTRFYTFPLRRNPNPISSPHYNNNYITGSNNANNINNSSASLKSRSLPRKYRCQVSSRPLPIQEQDEDAATSVGEDASSPDMTCELLPLTAISTTATTAAKTDDDLLYGNYYMSSNFYLKPTSTSGQSTSTLCFVPTANTTTTSSSSSNNANAVMKRRVSFSDDVKVAMVPRQSIFDWLCGIQYR
ncbi:hypothetical protein HDV05_005255 [Chytridiales sp. JEL 0842]|nr:hypothetical protein HDV05_005255 [Chytridiales sp. JEL 0842]